MECHPCQLTGLQGRLWQRSAVQRNKRQSADAGRICTADFVDEKILRFEVAVQNVVAVTELETSKQLIHERLQMRNTIIGFTQLS